MDRFIDTARKIAGLARETKLGIGKSYTSQMVDILRLRLSSAAIGVSEYYDLRLFEDDRLPNFKDKRHYVGRRVSRMLDRRLNADHSRILANDKIVNYALLAGLGFPIPTVYATYSTAGRRVGNERRLSTLEAAASYLKNCAVTRPIFIKPAAGTYGRGTLGIEAYLPELDRFRLLDGKVMETSKLLADFDFRPYKGMLIQEVLQPHSSIAEITGPRVSCIRAIVVVIDGSPRLHTAFWKIVSGNNITDNFSLGKTGNLLAAIDISQGTLYNAIADLAPFSAPASHHPTTGKPLRGFQLPEWQRTKALCLEAACHFPGLRLQNWDIAVCDRGPLLMELNTEADRSIPQSVTGKPILDELMRKALAQD